MNKSGYMNRQRLLREVGIKINEPDMENYDWDVLSKEATLSAEFIREFKDKLNWFRLSIYQDFSEPSLREFKDYILWNNYFFRQKVSYQIIKQFIIKTNFRELSEFYTSHLNDTEKKEIEKLLNLKYMFAKKN